MWRRREANPRHEAYEALVAPTRGFGAFRQFPGAHRPVSVANPLVASPWSPSLGSSNAAPRRTADASRVRGVRRNRGGGRPSARTHPPRHASDAGRARIGPCWSARLPGHPPGGGRGRSSPRRLTRRGIRAPGCRRPMPRRHPEGSRSARVRTEEAVHGGDVRSTPRDIDSSAGGGGVRRRTSRGARLRRSRGRRPFADRPPGQRAGRD